MNFKEKIKAEALRLGFALAGFTDLKPPRTIGFYRNWLKSECHATMGYLARSSAVEKRAHPAQILPQARTILTLAMRYPRPEDAPAGGDHSLTGKIAAYAWGDDYHLIIPARMAQLVTSIEEILARKLNHKMYTDTGPLLERDLAQRSGLGWIGKNTCLIEPSSGSYYLLAELLLDEEIDPDSPFKPDHCGNCRRCIDACPTGCILPDRTIDSRRCISYLTIENKSEIEPKLRPMMGNWVFGCDVCQQVCPWNVRFAQSGHERAFAPRQGVPRPSLSIELSLSPQEFNHKFKNSPIQRTRRRGYLRNIAVALGNSQNPEAVPALATCLENESEPLVRAHAAWALGSIKTHSAKQVLNKTRKQEPEEIVCQEIENALSLF